MTSVMTRRCRQSKKLESVWTGPYKIVEKNSEVNYTVKKERKILSINKTKLFIEA